MFTSQNQKEKKTNSEELMSMLHMINSKLDMLYMINSKLDMLLVQNNMEEQQTAESEKVQGEYKKKSEDITYMG